MASTPVEPAKPLTFAEFEQLPDPREGRYELRNGALIHLPPRSFPHVRMQKRLCDLLQPLAGAAGVVHPEIPFRLRPEYEYQQADVALLTAERWRNAGQYLIGAPELVIEVLSPSNRQSGLSRNARLCLENGSREYWLVDMDRREVRVLGSSPDERVYGEGDRIPLWFDGEFAVSEIFA